MCTYIRKARRGKRRLVEENTKREREREREERENEERGVKKGKKEKKHHRHHQVKPRQKRLQAVKKKEKKGTEQANEGTRLVDTHAEKGDKNGKLGRRGVRDSTSLHALTTKAMNDTKTETNISCKALRAILVLLLAFPFLLLFTELLHINAQNC